MVAFAGELEDGYAHAQIELAVFWLRIAFHGEHVTTDSMQTHSTCMGILPFGKARAYTNRFDLYIKPLVQTHVGLVYVDARKFYETQRPKIDVIFEMIKTANLVIAEISEPNPNVFLELGFALACGKRLVILCTRRAWKSCWEQRPPFDLQGRELLIYDDDTDLKVRLGSHIAGALTRSRSITVSWRASDGRSHIRSATEFSVRRGTEVWSDGPLAFPFILGYEVKLASRVATPDVRLHIASTSQDYPRVTCIFPWSSFEEDPKQSECHIDWFPAATGGTEVRLQQVPVCPKKVLAKTDKWTVFVTFRQPNLVFESSLFQPKVERLVVSMNQLLDRGLPLHNGLRLGFQAEHTDVSFSNITIQEILSA